MQLRATQTALAQLKPGPQSLACRQCFAPQRGWAPPLHSSPSRHCASLVQPGAQPRAPLQAQRIGSQMLPAVHSLSVAQFPSVSKQVPQPHGGLRAH